MLNRFSISFLHNEIFSKIVVMRATLMPPISHLKMVYLKKYQSINSGTISDRLVEPFGFTDDYTTVMAYEISSKKNKTFHIDRIAYVDFAGKPFKNSVKFVKQIPDVFGFSYSGETYSIQLELDLKQVLLLKEQYPSTAPFIHHNQRKNTYELKVQVNDLKPIDRFMRGIDGAQLL